MTASKNRTALLAEGFASIPKAAAYLAISRSRMYELVRANVISHGEHGGRIVVPWAALRGYAQERLVIGRVA